MEVANALPVVSEPPAAIAIAVEGRDTDETISDASVADAGLPLAALSRPW